MSPATPWPAVQQAMRQSMDRLQAVVPAGMTALVMVGNALTTRQALLQPEPRALLACARSLLEQAAELLPDTSALRARAEYAATQLLDRFLDDA